MHSLIDIKEDVGKFNCGLQEMFAFDFENFENSNSPLSQITKRLGEVENSGNVHHFEVAHSKISTNYRISWFLTSSGYICNIIKVLGNGELIAKIVPFHCSRSYFDSPN